MFKVMMLDSAHLFIKYAKVQQVVQRSTSCTQVWYFAVYDIQQAKVLCFLPSTSTEVQDLFKRFADHFWCTSESAWGRFINTYSNNLQMRESLPPVESTSERDGPKMVGEDGVIEPTNRRSASIHQQALQRVIVHLPMAPQSVSPSPYFDQGLFQYDDKLISALERPKPCADHPIKFISRTHKCKLRFKMDLGQQAMTSNGRNMKRIVSYVFHPTQPFALSQLVNVHMQVHMHMQMQPQIINVHMRV
jgi:de-etiolated-1